MRPLLPATVARCGIQYQTSACISASVWQITPGHHSAKVAPRWNRCHLSGGLGRFTPLAPLDELAPATARNRCSSAASSSSAPISRAASMKRSRWVLAIFPGAFVMLSSPKSDPAYLVYCDEFGDPGLTGKGSDWFIVSAVVVRAEHNRSLPKWIAHIKRPMRGQQRPDLHFYKLNADMKRRSTRFLSRMPVRCFSLLSHKQNMVGHRNRRCEEAYAWREYDDNGNYRLRPRKTWFHNFALKVLLERVTEYCADRCIRDYGVIRPIRITIGQKGGFDLPDFKSTLYIDRSHAASGRGVLPYNLAWSVVDIEQIETAPAAHMAGLQLADIVCGSFSHAVDETRFGRCDITYALDLLERRRMALKPGTASCANFGVTGLPWNLSHAKLSNDQKQVFLKAGYIGEKLVRPGSILPRGR